MRKKPRTKKKPNPKSAGKERSEHAHSTVKQNEHKSQEIINAVLATHEAKSQGTEFSIPEAQNINAAKNESQAPVNENHNEEKSTAISTQQNSAHFPLPPDSEDL